jgi:hypothetical protein
MLMSDHLVMFPAANEGEAAAHSEAERQATFDTDTQAMAGFRATSVRHASYGGASMAEVEGRVRHG